MKSYEYEASKIKNEVQTPIVIKLEIKKDSHPSESCRPTKSFGSFGWIQVYGELTDDQRSDLISHMENYLNLLIHEYEAKVKFRKEWDSLQDQ